MTGAPSHGALTPEAAATRPTDGSGEGWRGQYEAARRRLGSDREARWLVEEASGLSWAELAGDAARVTEAARARLASMVKRRAAGEPLQYVIGHWSFRNLDLTVDRRVLIPRPETERVVEAALEELDRARDGDPSRRLIAVDLGTGSGAIALSIVAERHGVEVWATDSSREALDVASSNLAGLGGFPATRVRLAHGHWWGALPDEIRGRVDLVVSNPPYISSAEMPSLDRTVRDWEPPAALQSGASGLEAIEAILAEARNWLTADGSAVVEIAPHQTDDAIGLAHDHGVTSARVVQDLAGRDRVLIARAVEG